MITINEIKSDIDILKEIASEIKEQSISELLDELSEKISSRRFYLVVVGLFKRGKSSIINALIGRELAPVAVTPLTSVITFFQYGSLTSAEVFFKNGNHVSVDLHDIFLYISEENNPKNHKNVEFVRISTKAAILENVILVDTPGLGSIFSHNTNTTLEFLPRIDAALFVLSADVPVSKADEEFLVKIKDTIPDVLFVLNKSDLLNEDELERMIKYNKEMLKEIFSDSRNDIELIPVSAREYFKESSAGSQQKEGNIKYLRDRLNNRFVNSKDEILTALSVRRLVSAADQLNTYLTAKVNTLLMPVHELEKKRESMQASIDYLASGKEDFDAVVKSRVQQLIASVTEQTEQKRKELVSHYNNLLIKESEKTWAIVRQTDANDFSKIIAREIISQYDDLKSNLEESVRTEFSNILLQYSTLSQSFLYEIIKQMKEVLGINIEGIISSFDLDVYTSFYFKKDSKYTVPSIKKNLFYKVLPDRFVKTMVLKQIYSNCLELINPNAGRIRGDIDYKISESYRKFRYHFDQKLHDLLLNLKNMIDESIASRSSINQNIEETLVRLKAWMTRLEEIRCYYC